MNRSPKRRIFMDYGKLTPEMRFALSSQYPYGISQEYIRLKNKKGKRMIAVLLDTDDTTILVAIDPKSRYGLRLLGDAEVYDEDAYSNDTDDDYEGPEDSPMAA